MLKKFLAVFFLFSFVLFSSARPIFAKYAGNADPSTGFLPNQPLQADVAKTVAGIKANQTNPNSAGTAVEILRSTFSGFALLILSDPPDTLATVQKTPSDANSKTNDLLNDSSYSSQDGNTLKSTSAVKSVSNMIGQLYRPPATATEYVADLMKDAGIATPAYAQGQGLGFAALTPVLETWKIFRNLAYFFYVIIFLVIGFMIMFRQKIGSQTVVTAQQALPKLLVSLIAVTFSYAIAGLMIEVMYLSMYLIVNVFIVGQLNSPLINGSDTLQSFGTTSNIFAIGGIILQGGSLSNANDAISSIVSSALGISSGSFSPLGTISGLAAVVVFAIALLFSLFRLFFILLKTYITIIISIVTAPVALMMGALPGNNAFANWIKGLIFNLAVFPTVLIVIVMAFLLQTSITASGGFLPPYIGGTGGIGAVGAILGLGILLIIPDIVEKVLKLAPAGPFDDLANKAGAAIKKGYSGGELINGLGITNTAKFPYGGLSGENIFRKAAILSAGGAAGAYGLVDSPNNARPAAMANSFTKTVQSLAKAWGDKELAAKKTP